MPVECYPHCTSEEASCHSPQPLLKRNQSVLIPQPPVALSCLDHKVTVLVFVSAGGLCH